EGLPTTRRHEWWVGQPAHAGHARGRPAFPARRPPDLRRAGKRCQSFPDPGPSVAVIVRLVVLLVDRAAHRQLPHTLFESGRVVRSEERRVGIEGKERGQTDILNRTYCTAKPLKSYEAD